MNKLLFITICLAAACNPFKKVSLHSNMTAAKLLGNPNYQAICYGGYRSQTRDTEPSVAEIKEDLKILAAINIKFLRTYNVHHKEASNLLQAIAELKKEDSKFEMYVMLGAWIDCKNAWTDKTHVRNEDSERNSVEITEAARLANEYPDIVKIISVGNEAMVKWAWAYYVDPNIILKWVSLLQDLKKQHYLPKNLWITSSDNFASWGGGDKEYHVEDLNKLIKAVDYISMHTYPMHDTHYNPAFWGIKEIEQQLTEKEKINSAMKRTVDYAKMQYQGVLSYMKSIGANKPVHLGETGWATQSNEQYGNNGSKASDEYKSAKYYELIRNWTNTTGITCFYFEAFDESWKNSNNPMGSENHFGLIDRQSQAKYALWGAVDKGVLNGLKRNGKSIVKSFNGDEKKMWFDVKVPSNILKN